MKTRVLAVLNYFKSEHGVYLIIIVDSMLLTSLIISAFFLWKELFEGCRMLRVGKISEVWHQLLWLGSWSRTMWAFCRWLTRGQQFCSLMSAGKNVRRLSLQPLPPAPSSSPKLSKAVWVSLWPASRASRCPGYHAPAKKTPTNSLQGNAKLSQLCVSGHFNITAQWQSGCWGTKYGFPGIPL